MVAINLHCKTPLSMAYFQTLLVSLYRCLLQHLKKYLPALVWLKPVNLWTLNSMLSLKPPPQSRGCLLLGGAASCLRRVKGSEKSCSKGCCSTLSPQYYLGSNYCDPKLTSRKTKWRGGQMASTPAKKPLRPELASVAFPAVSCAV